MGCVHSSSNRHDHNAKQVALNASYESDANHRPFFYKGVAVPHPVVLPDPDLGWQRAYEGSGPSLNEACSEESFAHAEVGKNLTSGNKAPLYTLPKKWHMVFLNDRNGGVCSCNLPEMALNLAARAVELASNFGITSEVLPFRGTQVLSHAAFTLDDDSDVGYAAADTTAIFNELRVPDYHWKLKERRVDHLVVSKVSKCNKCVNEASRGGRRAPLKHLQKFEDANQKVVLADCGVIGMNVSEQLYRLERGKKYSAERTPSNTFGWSVMSAVAEEPLALVVASPDKEAFLMVPEELIMNVASWIQDTYLTQAVLQT